MEEIYSYYKENIDAYTRRLGNLKKKIHLMGSIRLALVVGAILSLMDIQGWELAMADRDHLRLYHPVRAPDVVP